MSVAALIHIVAAAAVILVVGGNGGGFAAAKATSASAAATNDYNNNTVVASAFSVLITSTDNDTAAAVGAQQPMDIRNADTAFGRRHLFSARAQTAFYSDFFFANFLCILHTVWANTYALRVQKQAYLCKSSKR